MTDEIKLTPAEPSPGPINKEFFQTLVASLSSGDPTALLGGVGMTPEQVAQLKASMEKDDLRWAKMGAQLDNVAGVLQMLADTVDKQTRVFGARVLQAQRSVEIIRRALKALDGFELSYERADADLKSKEAEANAQYDKAHSSEKSTKVMTSTTPGSSL